MDASESAKLPPWMSVDASGNKSVRKSLKEKALKHLGGKVTKRVVARSERPRPERDEESEKYPHKLRLVFQQKCPKPIEIRKLHPKIAHVVVPKRPPSCRWCTLKFTSAESCEEARSVLNNKRVPKIKGILKCFDPTAKILSEVPDSEFKENLKTELKTAEVIHARIVNKKIKNPVEPTIDFKINSTERELNVRFGVYSNIPKEQQHSNET